MADITENMSADEFLAFIEEESQKPLPDESIPVLEESEPVVEDVVIGSEEVKEADANIEVVETDGTEKTTEDFNIDQEQQTEPEVEDEKDLTEKTSDTDSELEELRKFKDSIVNQKITVDGVEIDGLSDPEAIAKMQQVYAENSGRLDQLTESRPVLEALKKNGLFDDKEKLALMIEAVNGNKDAVKRLLKDQELDPFELDMDDIDDSSIDPSKHFASSVEMKFDDMINEAANLGVEDKLNENVIQRWDNDSIVKLLEDTQSKQYLMRHIKDGSFEKVNAKIKSKEFSDFNGQFKRLSDFDKYVLASNELASEYESKREVPVDPEPIEEPEPVQQTVPETEKRRSKSTDQDRLAAAKAASTASETVDSATSKASGTTDLMALSNEDFLAAMRRNL